MKTSQLMLYREIVAVCSQIQAKHNKSLNLTGSVDANIPLSVDVSLTSLLSQSLK